MIEAAERNNELVTHNPCEACRLSAGSHRIRVLTKPTTIVPERDHGPSNCSPEERPSLTVYGAWIYDEARWRLIALTEEENALLDALAESAINEHSKPYDYDIDIEVAPGTPVPFSARRIQDRFLSASDIAEMVRALRQVTLPRRLKAISTLPRKGSRALVVNTGARRRTR
jgi:hypothetical protein